jgi:HEAT repeat protein
MRKLVFCLWLATMFGCQGDPNKPDYWVSKLGSKRFQEKVDAANWLRRNKDVQAAPQIAALLKDEDPRVRAAAANALGELGDKSVVPQLIDAVDFSAGAGSDRDTRAVNEANRQIAKALGALGDHRAAPILLKMLNSKDSFVKLEAVESLGELREPTAVAALMAIATDDNQEPFIAKKAIIALGRIGDPQSVPALEKMLFRERSGISFYPQASFALFQIGEPAATPLIALLEGRDKEMEKWAEENKIIPEALYAKTAQVLGDIADPRSEKALIAKLKYNEGDFKLLVRSAAAESLGRMRDKAAAPVIALMLGEEEANIRDAYGRALVMIGDPATLPMLLKAAQFGSWDAREGSIHAFSNLAPGKDLATVQKIAQAEPARWLKECTDAGNEKPECDKVWPDHQKQLDAHLARLKAAAECNDNLSCWEGKLKDPSGAVRERAAWQLGHMAKPEAIPVMIANLQDEDLYARFATVTTLGWLLATPEGKPQSQAAADKLHTILDQEEGKQYYIKVDEDLRRLAAKLDQSTAKRS